MQLPASQWHSKRSSFLQLPAIAIAIKKAKNVNELTDYFDKEAGNLHRLREYRSKHLIKPIAAYKKGQDRCLMFPWAEGGNLCSYWKKRELDARDKASVQWQLEQFAGICSALVELHVLNVRHGDLKPENILWFEPNKDKGILQIADMGLTAFHQKDIHTKQRKGLPTATPSGTSRYEPPEMDEQRDKPEPRSRQYDIWSMGCIIFELLLWLVYGNNVMQAFRDETRRSYFWEFDRITKTYLVHPYVVSHMKVLRKHLQAGSAYHDLLDLVQTKLLVVRISEDYVSVPDCREIASEVHECIKSISNRSRSEDAYLTPLRLAFPADEINGHTRQSQKVHQKDGSLAAPERQDIPKIAPTITSEGDIIHEKNGHQSSKLNDDWSSIPDNEFAAHFFDLIGWDCAKPPERHVLLCSNCSSRKSAMLFDTVCDLSRLKAQSHGCDMCALLQEALARKGIKAPRVVELRQNAANVGLKNGPNLLSIYSEPSNLHAPDEAHLGLPRLLDQATPEFFTLLKEWIRVCDSDHDACRRDDEEHALTMPTRLIEVGKHLRLVEAASIGPARYIALSHCWGPLKEDEKFCTYISNISQFQTSINFDHLPRTFRDAVTVTRGLGIDYIWIDSLCIIQDDNQDWQNESSKMEQVFSAAYCTIGSSSAKSSLDGFLVERPPRSIVELRTGSTDTRYVCVDIDDFHTDVELGELNSRGWVLQERALSRRTVFFTSRQVYWECGAGIHCETLTRLQNSKVAFLGDANFPKSAIEHYRDGRQLLIQDLYERYSGLAFTKPSDRAVAILGLQNRLARTFKTQAAYGLFAVYFARGLLWKRRDWKLMTRIAQPAGRRVPSWSSFSKEGRIKYLDATNELKFKEIDWATSDFENPFLIQKTSASSASTEESILASFRGLARRLIMIKRDMLVMIQFDNEEDFNVDDLRCVVIGRDKMEGSRTDPKQYVLVIHQARVASGERLYERVGVASLMSSYVANEGSWVTIR
ncbi:hypothetical protein BDV96DRAFT_506859 [Lophiotrema nucula]|uniref:Protein kinase domain-containing protein n=1 Tax=Lophiotrema nucula TaxID=690887 RepID=A0A6A5YL22_9PLEO|nr:hypothetical protein BDV96DRAFT_506859 [Lophiotrema nucula]